MDIGTIDKIKGFLVIDYNDDLRNKFIREILDNNENFKFLFTLSTKNSIDKNIKDGKFIVMCQDHNLNKEEKKYYSSMGFCFGTVTDFSLFIEKYKSIKQQNEIIKEFDNCNVNAVKRRI
ncbi:hypothetical protein PYT53_004526 [Salmonella enterica]|nr:hypothetical protein [Salmonella enterica]